MVPKPMSCVECQHGLVGMSFINDIMGLTPTRTEDSREARLIFTFVA